MVKGDIRGFDRLKKAIIKWGYECNSDCIFCHCFEDRERVTLTEKELLRRIDAAADLRIKILLFSGGEPLLIQDLCHLMKYTLSKGIYSGLITNGRLLSHSERLKELHTAGLRYIYMSITGLDSQTYAVSTGVNGVKEAIFAILNIIKYQNIFFTVNIPIIRQNISQITDMAVKLSLVGVDNIKLSVIEPKGLALRNYKAVVPPLSQTAAAIKTAIKEVEKGGGGGNIFHDGLPSCLSPNYRKYNRDLFSENILYMCESFEGRFYKTDYNNRGFVDGVCTTCTKRKDCRGIYIGYIENDDIPLIPFGNKRKRLIENDSSKNRGLALIEDKNYEVNIGKVCNNSCIFCANGNISKEENRFVEYEKIVAEIEKAKRDGFNTLGFLGGEITIHPDVFRIIRYARRAGFERIALCTNGRRLCDRRFAEEIVRSGVTRFMISIHSHKEEIENYLNGRKNAFAEKIDGIKNILLINKEERIKHGISLNTCIHRLNYKELIDLATCFKNLGIKDIRFNFIRPENRAEQDKNIIPKMTEVSNQIYSLIEWNEREGNMHLAIGDIPFCLLPEKLLGKSDLLRKYIGEFRDLNTFVTTFRSRTDPDFVDRFSWRERKSGFLKAKSPLCRECIYDPICEGLFKSYINLYGIREINPIKESKR